MYTEKTLFAQLMKFLPVENDTAGKEMSHVKEDYLVTYVKSHIIFFKRLNGIVHVIRILHQRMDIESNHKKR